jgi:hypothetical protein
MTNMDMGLGDMNKHIFVLCIEYLIEFEQEVSHFYQVIEAASADGAKRWIENSLFKMKPFADRISDNLNMADTFNGLSLRDRNGYLEYAWTIEELEEKFNA